MKFQAIMQSIITTAKFILLSVIKQIFGAIADVHKWQFGISINLSKYQYDGMCATIVIQCMDSSEMMSITSPTTAYLHISTINDWKCLERVNRCFLNAQLSSPLALIVSISNADNYVGWSCRMQKTFTARQNQIEVLAHNCSKERLKRSVMSKSIGKKYHYESIRSSPIYATYKTVCFIVILGITGYCIAIYLIFCIILAQHARIEQQQTVEEIEFYKQTSERKIKQWIRIRNSLDLIQQNKSSKAGTPKMIPLKDTAKDLTNLTKVSAEPKRQSSDLSSSELLQQLPEKHKPLLRNADAAAQFQDSTNHASLIFLKMNREDQDQESLQRGFTRRETKWHFKKWNKTKSLLEKTTKNRSGVKRPRSSVNLPTATSVSRIGIEDSLSAAKMNANKLDQKRMEERRKRIKSETFSRSEQRVTAPHERVENWRPCLQTKVLKRKPISDKLDSPELPEPGPLRTIPSPRPMIVQLVHDIPSGMEIPPRRMRSQSCSTPKPIAIQEKPFQQSNLICKRENVKDVIEKQKSSDISFPITTKFTDKINNEERTL
uniref:Uncharacterized protein n=1 Tax=Onchocerca volvulus TaxID=6282 RepID=A0A8R1Y5S0_ONCVO